MTYRRVITLTLAYRPNYTREVLAALSRCRGINDYLLLPTIEPVCTEVIEQVDRVNFCECLPHVNASRQGCDANTLLSLKRGFGISDYVIHLEDDIVLTSDALEYFEHCRAYDNDPNVFTVTAYNRMPCEAVAGRFYTCHRRPWFHPWGWATWIDRFEEMVAKWDTFEVLRCSAPDSPPGKWDAALNRWRGSIWDTHCVGRVRAGRHEIYPRLSRAQNIGELNGENVEPDFQREHVRLEYWGGIEQLLGGKWLEEPA
jgi:hypothetical protein